MPAGRPSKLSKEVYQILPQLIQSGATDTKIAEILGVSQQAISEWKKNNREFLVTYNLEKEKLYGNIEKAMQMSGLGFKKEVNGEEKYFPPNVQAGKFVLVNARPDKWRPETAVESGMNITGNTVQVLIAAPRPEKQEEEPLTLAPRPTNG